MTRTAARQRLYWLGSAAVMAMIASTGSAQEMPSGGQIVAGSAAIGGSGADMVIKQSSGRAVIDWKQFSVGAGGRVTIQQPDAGSALLNRVTGGDMSKIAGNLSANGQVFLVNRNGIVITPTGNINAGGGFIASTLDISNDDFMAGRLRFGGSAGGMVLNQGRIAGGAIALLGANVANEGLIVSALGKVALGSGEEATLDLSGDGYLQVLLPADLADAGGRPLVSNSGRIEAEGGYVVLSAATARTAVRQSVNMSGVIVAKSVSAAGGVVLLNGGAAGKTSVTGTIDASGADRGGRIDVTGGDTVELTGATLTATGGTTGGLVRVGGMFQGGGLATAATAAQTANYVTRFGALPALASAGQTLFDAGSSIDVSGGTRGGAAILWSENATVQSGLVRAGGGQGGAVELSSGGHLTSDLSRVSAGVGGTVLLDPKNIWIDQDNLFPSFYTATALPADGSVGYADAGADPDTTYFKVGDIMGLMNAGTDVLLRASNDIQWNASNAAVDFSFASGGHSGNLTLSAGRSVAIAGYLSLYSSSLTVIANDSAANGVVDADRDAGQASIDTFNAVISAQTASSQTPGNISLTLGTGAGLTNHGIATSNRIGNISGGNISFSTSGQASTWSFFPEQGPGQALDPVNITATGAVTISGSILGATSGGLTFSGTTVTWTDEATRRVANNSGGFVAFVENGVTTRYGIGLGGSDLTRVALGKGSAYSPITYGDASPAAVQYRITAGTLRGGDTMESLAATFDNLTTTGLPGAFAAAGTYTVATSATIDATNAPAGYFFDLRGASGTLTINPKALLPTVTNGSYTYGAPSALVTLSGVVNNDAVAPVATLDTVTGHALIANGTGFGFGTTLAAGDHSFTLTGLTGASAGNYTLDTSGIVAGTIAVARKALTYQISNATSTYGTVGTTSSALSGVVGSDSVALAAVTSSGFSSSAGVGTYPILGSGLTGSASGNYTLASSGNADGLLTIQPKPITYAATGGTSVYGDAPTVAAPTLNGIINGDIVAATLLLNGVSATLSQTTNVGSYGISAGLSGTGAGNYVIANTGNTAATYTITRRPLSFTVADVTGTYGTAAGIVTVSGLTGLDDARPYGQLDGETLDLDSAGGTGFGFITAAAGTHSFIFDGIRGSATGNYLLNLGSSTRTAVYTVNPKTLTYAIADMSRTYRTSAPLPGITLNGVIAQDNAHVAASLSIDGTAISDPSEVFALNAGTYSATANALTGSAAANYRIASTGNQAGAYVVSPALIGYALTDTSATYGTAASLPTPVLSNIYFQDDVHGVVSVSQTGTAVTLGTRTPVGSYLLSVTSLTGTNAGNYQLASGNNINALLTINPKTLTYSVAGASTVYGKAIVPTVTLNGVVTGDTVTGKVGTSDYDIQGEPFFDLPARPTVGTHFLGLQGIAGADAVNYALASSGNSYGTLTIAAKHLSYQLSAASLIYGDATALPTASLTGVEAGDDVSASRTNVLANGQAYTQAAGLAVGTYGTTVYGVTGAASSNYVLDGAGSATGALTITPRPVTAFVSLSTPTSTVPYGSTVATGTLAQAVLGGVMNWDTGSIGAVLVAPTLPASGAGMLKAGSYTFSIGGITGSAASNYVLTGSSSATLTVAPLQLGYSSYQGFSATYGSTAVLAAPSLSGVLPGDAVTSAGYLVQPAAGGASVTIGAQTPAGAYTVTARGLSGADAANYASTPISTTLTIAPKVISYATANTSWTYGDTPALGSISFTGLVGADVVSGARAIAFTDRTDTGTYANAIASLTGAAAGNYSLAASGNTIGTIKIAARPLSFIPSANTSQTVAYLDPTQGFGTLGGVLAGDTVTAQTVATSTTRSGGGLFDASTVLLAGSYVVSLQLDTAATYRLSGASARNYVLAVTPQDSAGIGTLIVNKRALTYTTSAPTSAVYGDKVAYSFALAGAPAPYLASVTPAALIDGTGYADPQAALNAGSHVITAALSDPNFYLASGTGATIAISKRPLAYTVTAPSSAIYGDLVNYGILLAEPVPATVLAEVNSGLRIDGQAYVDPQLAFTAGAHTLSVSLPLANYVLSGSNASITIAKRRLTYTLTAPSTAIYGDTVAYTATVQGVVPDRIKAEATPVIQVDGRSYADPQLALTAGTHTLTMALASPNFDFSGTAANLTIAKRPLTLSLLNASTVYGTNPDAMVSLANVARDDSFDITVTVGGMDKALNRLATGYGAPSLLVSGYYYLNAGSYDVSLKSITGSALANYDLTATGTGKLTVTPKPLTYSIASATGQYGGLTSPDPKGDPLQTGLLSHLSVVRLTGLISGDQGGVAAGYAGVIVNGVAQAYSTTLAPGTYAETGLSLSGDKAPNYMLATTGNTTSTLTITPAVLKPEVSSGGRLYDNGDRSTYQLVDTPGVVTYLRAYGLSGLVGADNVGTLVQVYKDGQPYAGTDFPVGNYELRPTALVGADAGKYTFLGGGSGTLLVQDSSIFGFSFLTDTPNSVYTPPASVTTFTSSMTGGAGGTATTKTGALSFVAGASGYAGATASVSYGAASLSTSVSGQAAGLASFGPTGVTLNGTVGANASVTLSVGPASYTYGAQGTLSGTATLDRNGANLSATANAALSQDLTVAGDLGGGVSGSTTTSATLFAEARTTNAATYADGKVVVTERQWVGVGASAGTGGSISGGGIGGSASVTVYSPGSLGLGAASTSGYSNGTVTVGFTLAISIGIGGLEISPSFSFDAAGAVQSVSNFANDVGSKLFGIGCDAGCRAGKAAQAAADQRTALFNQAADLLEQNNGKPNVQLMSLLEANPGITSMSYSDVPSNKAGLLQQLQFARNDYGGIPDKLNSVVQQEQAIARRLQANPGSLSFADMAAAQSLRAQEASLIGELGQLGGKVQVADGKITMVPKG